MADIEEKLGTIESLFGRCPDEVFRLGLSKCVIILERQFYANYI
jgi:hypothetical protein